MDIDNSLRLSLLFELYGQLLTSKQILFLKDFLDHDISLSEIAKDNETSRQSVCDLVKRSLRKLESYEQKLRLFDKLEKIKLHANNSLELLKSGNETSCKKIATELNKLLEVL